MAMIKSKCEEISPLISSFIDGELSEAEDMLVSEHIGSCSSCNKLYARISGTVSLTKGLPSIEADSAVFVADLRHKMDLSNSRWLPEGFYSLSGKFVMSFACFLLVVTVGYKNYGVSTPVNNSSVPSEVITVAKVTPADERTLPSEVITVAKVTPADERTLPSEVITVAKVAPADERTLPSEVITVAKVAPSVAPLVNSGGNLLASAIVDKSFTPELNVTLPVAELVSAKVESNLPPVSNSGIDWNNIDLKKAAANYYSSPSGDRMRPPVYTTFEQIQSLYGKIATDVSGEVSFPALNLDAGGLILLEVNDQSVFFPSFYKNLLNDDDYEVRSLIYNQYDESSIIVEYKGDSPFEAGFNTFTSIIDNLDSVVGILSVKGGESASSILQLTIRPASQPVDK
jgi:hypothetical protein